MNSKQKFIVIKSALLLLLTSCPIVEVNCISIQALLNLDNDSEDLIELLIEKLDSIIDPKISDSQNATNELAYALLRIGPLITMNGTISDATKGLTLSFSCNVKADTTTSAAVVSDTEVTNNRNLDKNNSDDDEIYWKSKGGILKPIVTSLDPIVHYLLLLILNGIISNVVTNIMTEAALLSNVNFV